MPSKDLTFRFHGQDVSVSDTLRKIGRDGEEQSKKFKDAFGSLPAAVTLAAVAGTIGVVKMASDFQAQMTLLQTAGGESSKNIKVVSDGIMNLASSTGESTQQLADGMYTVEKAGIRGGNGLLVLKAAAEGAKAENVDLATATNALTSVMMSYHLKASQAVSVQNMLVAGSGMAKTTMQEYAGSLSAVIPVASAAGIGFDQVGGAIATLTQHGTSAQEATQELANTIRSLQAPSQVSQKAMQQLGINVTDLSSNLGKRGLTGTIDLITNAIAKNMGPSGLVMVNTFKESRSAAADAQIELGKIPAALQPLAKGFLDGTVTQKEWRKAMMNTGVASRQLMTQFQATVNQSRGFNDLLKSGSPAAQTFAGTLNRVMGGATGMNTALMLGGENMAYFKKATEEVGAAGRRTGTDISTWGKTQATFKVQADEALQSLKVMGITIGTAVLPAATQMIRTVGQWTKGLVENKPALTAVMSVLGVFVGLMVTVYAVQKTVNAVLAIQKVAVLASAAAQWVFNAAMDANPIMLVITAIAALVAGLVWFFTQTKLGKELWAGFVNALGVAWNWLWNSVIHPVALAIGAIFGWLWNTVIKPVVGLWVLEFKILEAVFVVLWAAVIHPVVNAIATIWNWLYVNAIKPVVGFIGLELKAMGIVFNWLYLNAVKPAFNAIGAVFTWWWNTIVSPITKFAIGAVHQIGHAFNVVFGAIGGAIQGAFSGVVQFVRGQFNGLIDVINTVIGVIDQIGSAASKLTGGGISFHVDKLPHLAVGGEVTRSGLAMVGEHGAEVVRLPAGASVYPTGSVPAGGGGGVTVQVSVQAGAVGNEAFLAQTVTTSLINYFRQGGTGLSDLKRALGVA